LCYLLFLLPALPVSCRKAPPEEPDLPAEEEVVVVADSVLTHLQLEAGGIGVRSLDLFIYDGSGTCPLERHLRTDSLPERLSIPTTEGDKYVVGIANSPKRFNLNALARLDAMRQLSFQFTEDDPDSPILGASCNTQSQAGTLNLTPLLCCIRLTSVANTMDGYVLLEDPRIRLCDLPDAAELLRQEEFRPSGLLDAGAWVPLPCDIGFFPQEPDTALWCYPNDTPEHILGTPRPSLEFACRIEGEDYSFLVPLPPLPRGCTKEVELVINGPDEYRYRVRDPLL